MHSFVLIIFCSAILYPSVQGIYFKSFPLAPDSDVFKDTSEDIQNDTLNILNDSSEANINVLDITNRTEDQRLESTSNILASENFKTDSNSTSASSTLVPSTKNVPNTQSTELEITLTEIFSNESNSTSSVPHTSGIPTAGQTDIQSASIGQSTNEGVSVSPTEDEEQEGVIRGKPSTTESTNATTTSKAESIYQKALSLINDAYTLSILIPVAAGVVFAATIIVTIATCRCLRRQCRRRRLRRKTLPESVKHLRPSDRARLLAESSDEEF